MGTLYIVGTPIGNLDDVTFRAVATLRQVSAVYAEDTRVTKKLLTRHAISVPLVRADEESAVKAAETAVARLAGGESIAFVTDAGTPNVSDPGSRFIAAVQRSMSDARISPIPGPSSLTAALSVSPFPGGQCTFLGFPPHKKGRTTFFNLVATVSVRPVVLFESPHRIQKTVRAIADTLGEDVLITMCRELTKLHETITTTTAGECVRMFATNRGRGEYVLIIQ